MVTEDEKEFWIQQEVVRRLILSKLDDTPDFWKEHEKMIQLQLKACYGKRISLQGS